MEAQGTLKKVFISSLGISFDLELRNDHLVAQIVCFHGKMTNDSGWNDRMLRTIQDVKADPEVNWVSSNSAQAPAQAVSLCGRQPSDVETAADMVNKLASVGSPCDALAAQHFQDDVEDGEAGNEEQNLDDHSGSNRASPGADRGDQAAASKVRSKHLHSPSLQKVWKPARKVQSMPEVRPMGSHQERMGNSWTSKLFGIFCLAASLFGEHSTTLRTPGTEGIYGETEAQAFDQTWSLPTADSYGQSGKRDELAGRTEPGGMGRSRVSTPGFGESRRCTSTCHVYFKVEKLKMKK